MGRGQPLSSWCNRAALTHWRHWEAQGLPPRRTKWLPRELASLITYIFDPGADYVQAGLAAGQHPMVQRAQAGDWGLVPGFGRKRLPFILLWTEQWEWRSCISQHQFHLVKCLVYSDESRLIKQLLRLPEPAAFLCNNVRVCFRERLSGRLPDLPGLQLILAGEGLGGSCWHFSPGIPPVHTWPPGRTKVSDGVTTEAGPQCKSNVLTRRGQVAETRQESGHRTHGGPCTLLYNS